MDARKTAQHTLESIGKIAIERYLATTARRNARNVYGAKCQEFKKKFGRFSTEDARFQQYTYNEYVAFLSAKSHEYNVTRRFDRACAAFVSQGGVA